MKGWKKFATAQETIKKMVMVFVILPGFSKLTKIQLLALKKRKQIELPE